MHACTGTARFGMRAAVIVILLWSTTASARHRHCTDACKWWGDGLLFGFLDDAFVLEHVTMPEASSSGTAYSATRASPFHVEQPKGAMTTLGYRSGVLWRDPNWIIGAEFAYGAELRGPTATAEVDGTAPTVGRSGELFDFAAVAGPHHRFGWLDVGGLVVTGVRVLQAVPTLPDEYTTCVGGAAGKNCYAFTQTAQTLVELRGRVEAWISPHVTLGASAGIELTHGGESFALELQVHLRAYDGS